jgi:hypothetical protein
MSSGIYGKLRSSCTSDDDCVMCLMKKERVYQWLMRKY